MLLAGQRCDRCIYGIAEAFNDSVDIAARHDEWRCEHVVISMSAVDCTRHGIAGQTASHRLLLDSGVEGQSRVEWLFCGAVAHILDGPEKSPAANIADVMVIGKSLP